MYFILFVWTFCCIFVCELCTCLVPTEVKKSLDPLEPESEVVMNLPVGVGNRTQILWKIARPPF